MRWLIGMNLKKQKFSSSGKRKFKMLNILQHGHKVITILDFSNNYHMESKIHSQGFNMFVSSATLLYDNGMTILYLYLRNRI